MKKLTLVAVCLLFSTTLMCQSKLDHPIETPNTNGVTTITISKQMFKNVESLLNFPMEKLTEKIKSVSVFKDKDKVLDAMKDIESSYSELISIKDNGNTIFRLLIEEPQDEIIKSFAMVITKTGESGLIIVNGNFKMEDFSDFMAMIK